MFRLDGHVALVTGAGQGVGAGMARVLAQQGAAVIVNDLFEERAEETATAVVKAGGQAVASAFDVTDYAAVESHVRVAEEVLGRHVDILVNNAGIAQGDWNAPFRSLTPEQWRLPIDLNIYGALNTTKVVIDQMCESGWGRVVQISSGSARTGQDIGVSMYAAGKSGIEGFMRHLAAEVGKFGVAANILALGLQSNLADTMGPAHLSAVLSTIPIRRLGDPLEVGAAVAYLASDESGGMTGQTIDFNGGTQTR